MPVNESETAIYGKKVFFLNPSYTLEQYIIERLRTMEYEVYVLTDYKIAKNIFMKNPDSICFINPDAQLNYTGWANYVKSFSRNPKLSSIKFGAISEKMKSNMVDSFKASMPLDAGFEIHADGGDEDTFRFIVNSMDKLQVKGLRQYLRASCKDDKSAEFFWMENKIMHKLKLIDISAVGVAALLPGKNYNVLAGKNEILNAVLVIDGKQYSVDVDLKMLKPNGVNFTAVFMFKMNIEKKVLSHIRNYISTALNKKLFASIDGLPTDRHDYNNEQ